MKESFSFFTLLQQFIVVISSNSDSYLLEFFMFSQTIL